MMWRVSVLVYIDSQIYKPTIRLLFEQFDLFKKKKKKKERKKKEKETIFLYHSPHFQYCLTMHIFNRKLFISR